MTITIQIIVPTIEHILSATVISEAY